MHEKTPETSLVQKDSANQTKKSLLRKSISSIGINRYRWVFLVICSLGEFSYFWISSLLASLQTQIQEDLDVNSTQYGLLQSSGGVGSWVMPILIGYFIDFYGARIGFIYGNLVVTLGLVTQSLAATYGSYWGMCAGGLIISFGTDALDLSNYKLLSKWFREKDMGLAFALASSMQALAGVAGGYVTPVFYNTYQQLGFPIFIAALISFFSYACAHISCEMDYRREIELNKISGSEEFTETIKFKDLKKFTLIFWLFIGAFIAMDALAYPISYFNSEYMQQRYNYDTELAGLAGQCQNLVPVIIGPIIGIVMDKLGKVGEQMVFGVIVGILSCVLQATLPNCDKCYLPMIPIFFQGLCLSISNLGIMVGLARLLDANMLGVALGVAMWIMEMIQAFFPVINGALVTATSSVDFGYYWVYIINGSIMSIGLLTGIIAIIYDRRKGNKLGKSLAEELEENPSDASEFTEHQHVLNPTRI